MRLDEDAHPFEVGRVLVALYPMSRNVAARGSVPVWGGATTIWLAMRCCP